MRNTIRIMMVASVIFAMEAWSQVTNPTYAQVMAGVRPRGACKVEYTLSTPAAGSKEIFMSPSGNDNNAGNRATPLKTLQKAVDLARAGDVITLMDGRYFGGATLKGASTGQVGKPVVIQAEHCGGATITSQTGTDVIQSVCVGECKYPRDGAGYATDIKLKGLRVVSLHTYDYIAFGKGGNGDRNIAIRTAARWTIEDCVVDSNTTGINARGVDNKIHRSQINYSKHNSVLANGELTPLVYMRGLELVDLIMNYNNQNQHVVAHEASNKILLTYGVLIDNVEGAYNYGPGMWLDWWNDNFIVRNSYFHHNRKRDPGTEYTFSWEAPGFWSEVNKGGLMEFNVFHDNVGGPFGLLETEDVEVRNNLAVGGGADFRSLSGRGRITKNIYLHHNHFKNFSGGGDASRSGDYRWDYDVWDNQVNIMGTTGLSAVQSKWGYEMHGQIGSIPWPLIPDSSLWNLGPDTTGPVALTAVLKGNTQILVQFNEGLDSTSAKDKSHYVLSSGQVVSATLQASRTGVILQVTGIPVTGSFQLTISNVKDDAATLNPSASKTFQLQYEPFSGVLEAEAADVLNGVSIMDGNRIGNSQSGDFFGFSGVDLGVGYDSVTITYGVPSPYHGNLIEIRKGSSTGQLLATVQTVATADWATMNSITVALATTSGLQDLYVVYAKGTGSNDWVADIDKITFKNSKIPVQVLKGDRKILPRRIGMIKEGWFNLLGIRVKGPSRN